MLPRRVTVKEISNGRYEPGTKPMFWEERQPAVETIVDSEGETITVYSLGSQATPAPGWELLLNEEFSVDGQAAYGWTLYGLS